MVKLSVMEQNETLKKMLPPRVIDSLTSGVGRIEKQPYLLLFPVLYDFLLWLGPKLAIAQPFNQLFSQIIVQVESVYAATNVSMQPIYDAQEALTEFLGGYNLFSIAKTFPIGVPALLANFDTFKTPLGDSQVFSLTSIGLILLYVIGLATVGIFLGTIFLRVLAFDRHREEKDSFSRQFLNSFIYTVLLLSVLSAGLLFSFVISSFFVIIVPIVGQFIFMLLTTALLMVLLPALYAFIPIFLYGQSFYQAILTSYKVVGLQMRYNVDDKNAVLISPRIVTFTMIIFVIYNGLNIIWASPPTNEWYLVIGILGHGFISTAILLACFDFFQKMCEWKQRITNSEVC